MSRYTTWTGESTALMHLTDKGIAQLAELLHKAGYAEIAPAP